MAWTLCVAASHSSHTGITAHRAAGRLRLLLFGREQGGRGRWILESTNAVLSLSNCSNLTATEVR